jgi:formylglycine-generating enzyme required for sulfatase activity
MKFLPAQPVADPNCPVVNIDWYEALAFCEVLNGRLLNSFPGGYVFSLPTEAQWEYACRAGTQTTFYNGDDLNQVKDIAWYSDNGNQQLQPLGKKLANAWGFHDMLGNVSEWCYDDWGTYPAGKATDWIADKGYYQSYFRVVRGGEYTSLISDGSLRCCGRIELPARRGVPIVGFRLALRSIYDPSFR